MNIAPHLFRYDGEAMVPLRPKAADRDFVVGEVYRLEIVEERSAASHRHYFASINEAWQNLPEEAADRFATPEDLRKFALIKTGFHDSRSIVASSKAEASRIAAFIRGGSDFTIVVVNGSTITEYRAKSQSLRAMGKQEFQASKDAVLGYISDLIGVKPSELEQARAA